MLKIIKNGMLLDTEQRCAWFDGSNAAIGDKVFSIALTGAVVFGGAYLIMEEQE